MRDFPGLVINDHVINRIVNANHASCERLRCVGVADCIRDRIRPGVPQPPERQRVTDKINDV